MTDLEKIYVAWEHRIPWNFSKNPILRAPAPFDFEDVKPNSSEPNCKIDFIEFKLYKYYSQLGYEKYKIVGTYKDIQAVVYIDVVEKWKIKKN